jgi:DNA replication protein DnaC
MPELKQTNDTQCKTVCSPLREDNHPSLSIYQNSKNAKWLYHDFGTGETGDIYDFAAQLYGLDIKTQFPEILNKIADDMQIDAISDADMLKVLHPNWNAPFDIPIPGMKERSRPVGITSTRNLKRSSSQEDSRFTLDIIPFANITKQHRKWMNQYGITEATMRLLKASFIKGYTTYEYDIIPIQKRLPKDEIWIAYGVDGCAKLYCPSPKTFRYLGKKPKNYVFGTKAQFEDETVVLLTGGEKDVLTLRSHGIEACCLNSESQLPNQRFLYDNYFQKRYKMAVLYDLDPTGAIQSQKIKEKFGLPIINLPDWVSDKGGKDVSDFYALGGETAELLALIEAATVECGNSKMPDQHLISVEQPAEKRPGVRTARQRMEDAKNLPEILPLVDVLFQKNELTILFGDTGKGKSIAAVAIADAISKGESFLGLDNNVGPQRVLYYDFELSDKQFEKRYSNEIGECYPFNDNFYIDNIDLSKLIEPNVKAKFEEILINKFKSDILEIQAEVVVIDNITYLSTQTPEDSQVALTMMKLLKELKSSMNISILVLAHTPKKIGAAGITIQDLAGSKHLSNFADGVIALGDVKTERNIRYLMQVKPSRSGEPKYDKNNVIVCELEKQDCSLAFRYVRECPEYELLGPTKDENEKEHLLVQMQELKRQGKTIREIADVLKMGKSTVDRWLKNIK